jgi:hypothetical protein
MTELAEQLAAGVQALRQERWHEARRLLEPVYADLELAAAADLADVRARVCSLYAQAALGAGAPEQADPACREALRLLRSLRDKPGLDAVRALQDRVVAALVEQRQDQERRLEQRRIARTPTEVLLAEASTDQERMELLVKKADALGAEDALPEGAALAIEALRLATVHGDVRWTVLAHLSLVRLRPDSAQQHLLAAWTCADAASEFNLVSVIARASEVSGVALPPLVGPHAGRDAVGGT